MNDLELAKNQGKLDYKKSYAENPYHESWLRGAWQQGWREANRK